MGVSQIKLAIPMMVLPSAMGAILFLAAGRCDLPFVWAVLAVVVAFFVAMLALVDPGLVIERQHPGPGNQDPITRSVGGGFLVAHWIACGLDVGRLHWSPIPWALQTAGLLVYAGCLCVNLWALRENPFYSSVVRIQSDRGQYPIVTGPYRYVRHPGYAASFCAMFSGGIALGSWAAMIPLLVFGAFWIRRTALEDAMLIRELPGYSSYAEKVRYRLLPGVY